MYRIKKVSKLLAFCMAVLIASPLSGFAENAMISFTPQDETVEKVEETNSDEQRNNEELEAENVEQEKEIDQLNKEIIDRVEVMKDIKEEKQVSRIAGLNRYETAVDVSKEAYENGSQAIIVANGISMIDALTASALAAKIDAPILLVDTNTIGKLYNLMKQNS